jgi:hypothetical protein
MRARNIPPSMLFTLLVFATGHVEAADVNAKGGLPPFCKATPQCSPERLSTPEAKAGEKGGDPVPKGAIRMPKKSEASTCDSVPEGRCFYLAATLQWACCSRSPYGEDEKVK